ncbi:tetratricopeptide repeat protein [Labrenzia sp. VG12]|uniref:tetratricopeptide repeat protein n=1 Tax=Labrenzia sp. VG12 TaxID=2021862 RepID=UPI000B8BDA3F|nr:tetratricopeptide repeat protein [Labrenzia sp. VG12]ASP35725.1 tetratricopeptide repeat protein 38 family protein [Labrenzia sp. VG12]
MRLSDQFGYDLTLSDRDALAAWNDTVRAFLAHGKTTPQHLETCLGLAPDFALGHAARGLFCLLLGRRELFATAGECLSIARNSARQTPLTTRETAVVDALDAWLQGFPSRSADLLDAELVKVPEDALMMKLVHAIRFVLGDAAGMRQSIERIQSAYNENHPAYGYLLGCRAFSLEETGDYRQAEASGRRGLEFARDDAWGLHAVAHVHDMTGRSEEGAGWLENHPDGWAHCNNFGYHVWWHLALMYLDQGNADRALALYDTDIRKDKTDDYRDISNAASLLVRLELEGVDTGSRWDELALLSDKRAEDGCNVFADLHYLLALLNGGRRMGADRLLAGLKQRAQSETDIGRITAETGLPTGLGLEQYRKGNYASAFTLLTSARDNLYLVGGSHAQRDVFERITIDAALRAGLPDDAERLIKDRTHKRGALDRFAEQRLETCEKMHRAQQVMEDEKLRARFSV